MNPHCESKHRRTRFFRAAMLVIALTMGCALPTAAPAQSTDIEDWRGFAAGSWVELRTTSETFDEQGQVVSESTSTIEYRVEHPRWAVWTAAGARIEGDVSRVYGDAFARILERPPRSAFVADGSPVTVFSPERIR